MVDAAWGWSGERVGFSATPLGREGLLTETINGADQVLIPIWRLRSAQVKSRGYNSDYYPINRQIKNVVGSAALC